MNIEDREWVRRNTIEEVKRKMKKWKRMKSKLIFDLSILIFDLCSDSSSAFSLIVPMIIILAPVMFY